MPLPYSLDLTRLAAAYGSGALTPAQVVLDVLAEIHATRSNPVWIHVASREALLARANDLEKRAVFWQTVEAE